jgi:hypothetical protein
MGLERENFRRHMFTSRQHATHLGEHPKQSDWIQFWRFPWTKERFDEFGERESPPTRVQPSIACYTPYADRLHIFKF